MKLKTTYSNESHHYGGSNQSLTSQHYLRVFLEKPSQHSELQSDHKERQKC